MESNAQITALNERAAADAEFRTQLEEDPVGTLNDAGYPDLAAETQQQLDIGMAVADRLNEDPDFLAHVAADPMAALTGAGMEEDAVEPFLRGTDAPEALLEKVKSDDVEAHWFVAIPYGITGARMAYVAARNPALRRRATSAWHGAQNLW